MIKSASSTSITMCRCLCCGGLESSKWFYWILFAWSSSLLTPRFAAGGDSYFSAMLNSFVHVIMYGILFNIFNTFTFSNDPGIRIIFWLLVDIATSGGSIILLNSKWSNFSSIWRSHFILVWFLVDWIVSFLFVCMLVGWLVGWLVCL
jgi:hypothetical protein